MKHIKNLVFDLDNTLYPQSSGCTAPSEKKGKDFFDNILKLSDEEYYKNKHLIIDGNTYFLHKLKEKGVSFEEFLNYVCEYDLSNIHCNKTLKKQLLSLPHQLFIFTDSVHWHVEDVLEKMQIKGIINNIFTIMEAGGVWKSHTGAFEKFFNHYKINPKETAIFEDSLSNLQIAKEVGMTTVFISEKPVEKPEFCDFMFKDINSALMLFE